MIHLRSATLLLLALPLGCIVQPEPPPPAAPASAPAGAAGGAAGTMPAAQPGAPMCDITARALQQTSPGPCGTSIWRFTHNGDDTYTAKEEGCAGADGVARYDGTTLVVDFKYADGAGQYSWPLDGSCQGAAGTVTWSAGPLQGQSAASTLAVAP